MDRQASRKRLLAAKPLYSELVEYDTEKFFVVAPTMKEKAAILSTALRIVGQQAHVDAVELNKQCLLHCLHLVADDGTVGPLALEPSDQDALEAEPSGTGLIDVLGPKSSALLNGRPSAVPPAVQLAEAQAAAKNA